MATEENNFNDNIDDVGSQDVAIPEIPDPKEGTEVKPGTIAEELTSQSGASIEERTQDKKRDAVLNLIQDVTAQREDIDKVMTAIPELINKMNQLAGMVDKQSEAINVLIKGGGASGNPAAPGGTGLDLDKVEVIGNILEKVGDIYTKVKGGGQGPAQVPLITQEVINEKMTNAFMNDLETGESIRSFITDSLKRTATRKIVKDSLSGLGGLGASEHGPA